MPGKKGLSTMISSVLAVAIAIFAAIFIASFIMTTSGQYSEQIGQQGADRLKCVYTDFYIKNGTFDAGMDCTRGVNHTLTLIIKSTGSGLVFIGDVIVESKSGNFSRFYIGRNLSAGETRIFNATGDDSCVEFVSQTASGFTDNIKNVYVGSTNCPSSDVAGGDFFAILGYDQTESQKSKYSMGLWHFNYNLSDNSGNSNDGNFMGGSPNYASSVVTSFGDSVQFDGYDDYIEVNNSPTLNTTNRITVEAWVYFP